MPAAFTDAGFAAVCYDKWDARPWRVIGGITFRSVTLTAIKPGPVAAASNDRQLLYRGPFATVTDDEGRHWQRGQRQTVAAGTARLLLQPVYQGAFIETAAKTADCCVPAEPEGSSCCAVQPSPRGCC